MSPHLAIVMAYVQTGKRKLAAERRAGWLLLQPSSQQQQAVWHAHVCMYVGACMHAYLRGRNVTFW